MWTSCLPGRRQQMKTVLVKDEHLKAASWFEVSTSSDSQLGSTSHGRDEGSGETRVGGCKHTGHVGRNVVSQVCSQVYVPYIWHSTVLALAWSEWGIPQEPVSIATVAAKIQTSHLPDISGVILFESTCSICMNLGTQNHIHFLVCVVWHSVLCVAISVCTISKLKEDLSVLKWLIWN